MSEHYLRGDLQPLVPDGTERSRDIWDWSCRVADTAPPEDVFRNKEGRKTLRFHAAGKSFFLKQHSGVGWGEIIKNLLQFRWPVTSARNEYLAVQELRRIGVDTMSVAAYARLGNNPAKLHSLVVTDDLVGTISLEDFCESWSGEAPPFDLRLKVIRCLARSASRMHRAGINHRDFYLCHFHLDPDSLSQPDLRCHLIDLHRAQLRKRTPHRWLVKDLAGLYFSAMDCGLSRRDLLRFMRLYSDGGLRRALGTDAGLWRDVEQRAHRLYRKIHGRDAPALAKVCG